ncbi:oocyte zinc finger protein XlCOF6-like [Huso huso]|uniref:Oocyte zinc finger protein XlCOF6-like n=1 Tax=Huso huso TaxID=61971 RepID=A0ABR0YES3_HUSHU
MHITDLKFVGDNREGEEEGGERARDREEEEEKIPELKEELLEQDIGVCKSEGSDMGLKFVGDHREGEEEGGERARDREEEEEEEKKIPELKEELLEQDIGVCKSEGSDMGLACHLCGELRVKVEEEQRSPTPPPPLQTEMDRQVHGQTNTQTEENVKTLRSRSVQIPLCTSQVQNRLTKKATEKVNSDTRAQSMSPLVLLIVPRAPS